MTQRISFLITRAFAATSLPLLLASLWLMHTVPHPLPSTIAPTWWPIGTTHGLLGALGGLLLARYHPRAMEALAWSALLGLFFLVGLAGAA